MSVKITQPIPPNVVEIGDEISQGVVDGLMSASPSPSSSNPYLTVNGASSYYLPLAGGLMNSLNSTSVSTVVQIRSFDDNSYISSEFSYGGMQYFYDGDVETQLNTNGVFFGLSGNFNDNFSFSASGITFADSTIQTTAAVLPPNDPDGLAQAYNNNGVWTNSPTFDNVIINGLYLNNDLVLNAGFPSVIKFDDGGFEFRKTNIKFPDGSTQASAFIPSNYLTASSTASIYLSQSSAASTYLTQSSAASVYTTKANNLSDLTSASTARTNLGLAYATDAQVIAGTSASTVLSPSNGQQLRPVYDYGFYELSPYSWSSAVTGGFFVGAGTAMVKIVNTQTAVGYGVGYILISQPRRNGANGGTLIDWSKKVILSARVGISNPADSNTIHRFMLGKSTASTVAGDLSVRGIGFKRIGTGVLTMMVHDGTTLSTLATSFTPSNNTAFDLTLVSDGVGTTTYYVNGSSVGSITGSPTTVGSGNNSGLFYESENIATTTASGQIVLSNIRASFGL